MRVTVLVQGHRVELELEPADAKGLLFMISGYVQGLTPDELEAWPAEMMKPAAPATHIRIAGREYALRKPSGRGRRTPA